MRIASATVFFLATATASDHKCLIPRRFFWQDGMRDVDLNEFCAITAMRGCHRRGIALNLR
jgi:hypothetical protein